MLKSLIYSIIGLLLLSNNLWAQSRFTFPIEKDARIIEAIEGTDGRFLLAGKLGATKNDTAFTPLLYTYNPSSGETVDINPFKNINRGFVSDLLKVGNEIKVLYNLFTTDSNQDSADFAILTLDNNFNLIGIQNYKSPTLEKNKVYIEKLIQRNGRYWAYGTFREFNEQFSVVLPYIYTAEINESNILLEGNQRNNDARSFISGFNSAFFKADTLQLVTQGSWSTRDEVSNYSIDNLNLLSKQSLFSTNGTSANENQNAFTDIQKLQNGDFVSSCIIFTSKSGSDPFEPNVDTSDVLLQFFTEDIERVNRVNLTEEYKNKFNGPGASHFISSNKICVGATINNVPGREIIQTGGPTYFPIMHYPENPESKVMAAMLNDNGDVLWKRVFDSSPDFELITEVVALQDGGCLLAGTRYNANNTQLHDPLLIFLDSNGVTSVTEKHKNIAVQTYPNPTQNELRVEWFPKNLSLSEITLYNAQGAIVLKQTIAVQNVALINLETIKSGTYFLSIAQKNGERFNSTIVKN